MPAGPQSAPLPDPTSQGPQTAAAQAASDRRPAPGTLKSAPPRRRIEGACVLLLALALYAGTALLTGRTSSPNVAYFDHLASAFLHGRLHLDPTPGEYDLTAFEGRWYVPFPPLPALLLMPLVAWLGVAGVSTVWFSVVCGAITVWLVWKLLDSVARRKWISLSCGDQRWLTVLFAIGCVHWHVALEGSVWFLAQTCTTLFLALAAWLATASRSPWPCGAALALALLGRPHVLLTWPLLYGLHRMQDARSGSPRGVSGGWLSSWSLASLTPAVGALLLLAWYNQARFGDPLDFGYTRQKVDASLMHALHAVGQFSWRHVPRNLWYILVGPPYWRAAEWFPRPDDHGLSLLLTTPALFALPWARRSDGMTRGAWLAVGLTLLPLLAYYNTGWRQFGYRFSLDFMTPLVVLLAVAAEPRISRRFKLAILVGVLVNAWGVIWWYTDWMDSWA